MKLREKMKRFCTLDVHNHAGFTLVELIIVIAILAILSTGAIAGYSAYVEKAKASADLNLLSAYNTAFTSACAINGVPMDAVEGTQIKLTGDEGSKTYNGITVAINSDKMTRSGNAYADLKASIAADFETYLGTENRAIAFQYYVLVVFQDGSFVGVAADGNIEVSYMGTSFSLSASDITNFNSSSFADIGAENLLGMVGMASGMIDMNNNSSTLTQLATSDAAKAFLFDNLNVSNEEEIYGILEQQFPQGDMSEEDWNALLDEKYNQVFANNAVLYAAQNTQAASKGIWDVLKAGSVKDAIKSNTNTDEQLAQSAMAFAMYSAYTGNDSLEDLDLNDVYKTLDSQEFKDYINDKDGSGQAQKDLDGYLSSMNMINTGTTDDNIVQDLLINGFNDSELADLINQMVGK